MEKILFETLNVSEEIKRAIRDMGFEEATPVQSQSIGPMMAGRDMVSQAPTGTGKTFTGLGAISKLSEDLDDELAVVVVCPYQHLVEQWVEDIVKFNINPIIGYSSSSQKNWKERLTKAIRNQKIRKDKRFFALYVQTQHLLINLYKSN